MSNTIPWRKDYEAFRGNIWTFGNYRISEDPCGFTLYHGDINLRRFSMWIDADQYACNHERNAR